MPRTTIADLQAKLAREEREAGALREWFLCTTRDDVRGNATVELELPSDDGEPIRVKVVGMARCGGGVAVVSCGKFNDFPEYLDDLLVRWEQDRGYAIRDAARKLKQAREAALRA